MNNNEKSTKTFRKEAIYVILFVCLCIAATAAAITSKNHKLAKQEAMNKEKVEAQKQAKKQEKPEITLVDDTLRNEKEYENSLEVKNNKNKKVTTVTNNNEIKVSKNLNTKMIKPVQGKIAREYSEVPVYWDTTGTYRPNFGMDIQAELGQKVVCVSDGIVVEVNDNKNSFGKQVVVDHQNGLKSVYANLSENISVKNGQKLKQGEKIGEVGNTSLRSSQEKYGSNLHFEILKDNENINPSKYIKY